MSILSAAQARELSGPAADDYLRQIEGFVRNAAEAGAREVIIRDEPYARWLFDVGALAGEPRKAVDALHAAGYTVSLFYQELSIAVDLGMKVAW